MQSVATGRIEGQACGVLGCKPRNVSDKVSARYHEQCLAGARGTYVATSYRQAVSRARLELVLELRRSRLGGIGELPDALDAIRR